MVILMDLMMEKPMEISMEKQKLMGFVMDWNLENLRD
jgi:hypothetical protein